MHPVRRHENEHSIPYLNRYSLPRQIKWKIVSGRRLVLPKFEDDPYRFVVVRLLIPIPMYVFYTVKPYKRRSEKRKRRFAKQQSTDYFLLEFLYELCLFLLSFLIIGQFSFVILMFFF